jgi:hypothetical protein
MNIFDAFKLWRIFSKVKTSIKEDKTMTEKLKSRKLWAMILAGALTAANSMLGIVPDESMKWILELVMVYIGGQAIADAAANYKKQGE